VQVHDFGLLDDGKPYLVLDYVKGCTLAEYLKQHGPMTLEAVADVFAKVCFGLAYAHDQGVIHRDIKPSNIMLVDGASDGAEGSVKILDFGIAKLTSREDGEIQALTRTGEIFGSPLYMSPEQCSGGYIDHRSDIYSLGCVLFEALTGTPPHLGQTALATMMLHQSQQAPTLKEASLGKEFPDALERIVAKMLHKSPAERYRSVGLVPQDLARVGGDTGLLEVSSSFRQTRSKASKVVSMPAGQFYPLLALLVMVPAVLAGLGGYLLGQSQGGSVSSPQPKASSPAKKEALNDSFKDINQGISMIDPDRRILQRLTLEDVAVTPPALALLRLCPRLNYLQIKEPMVDDEFVRAVT
jgi:serine/threonine protein kinase